MQRSLIWIGIAIGSTIGSSIPLLWGASFLSFSSVILSALGGFVGIWAGYTVSKGL
ncbi:MAG TPA: hypothetical protein VMV38_02490 [Candidatus Paceibacterota bacterium]|nr:hypothetical protein [Candidatus Paceibacterota bacterium]